MKWNTYVMAAFFIFSAVGVAHAEPTIEETFEWLNEKSRDIDWTKNVAEYYDGNKHLYTYQSTNYSAGTVTVLTDFLSKGEGIEWYRTRDYTFELADCNYLRVSAERMCDGYVVKVKTRNFDSLIEKHDVSKVYYTTGRETKKDYGRQFFAHVWYGPSKSQAERIANAWSHAIRLACEEANIAESKIKEPF